MRLPRDRLPVTPRRQSRVHSIPPPEARRDILRPNGAGAEGPIDTHSKKTAVRAEIAAARAVHRDEQAAADAVAGRVLGLPAAGRARTVLAYAALPGELDPAPAAAALRSAGARIAYPRVCGPDRLALHWADAADLAPGYCGIREPAEDAESARPEEIDLALVPGVAFGQDCCRLGRGGGFYDRLLPHLRDDAFVVGLAYDEQIVDDVPREAHDVPLDAVVTPTRTLTRPPGTAG